jgi:hypothetical protein
VRRCAALHYATAQEDAEGTFWLRDSVPLWGQKPPKKVGATASPLSKNGTSNVSPDPDRSRSLKAHGSGVERTIPVELPQGEYVVHVHVEEQQGGASYFFRITVE